MILNKSVRGLYFEGLDIRLLYNNESDYVCKCSAFLTDTSLNV